MRIKHKFLDWGIYPKTETLIIGTFNPETSKDDFFYGSGHNYLWKLLPLAYGEESLKGKLKED
jgi:G:T/U-mismatch repair DNA glycosylase